MSLSEEEKFKFDKIVSAQMSLYFSAYVQYTRGLIDIAMWRAYVATIQEYLKRPGFMEMWKGNESLYPKPFTEFVNGTRK